MSRYILRVEQDNGKKYRWWLVASNGRNTAVSGESFATKSSAVRAAANVCQNLSEAYAADRLDFYVDGEKTPLPRKRRATREEANEPV